MITILMLVYNNEERARYTVESIRCYHDVEGLELVVINNASTDSFDIWAKEQTDFTYVYMEKKPLPAGKALNDVIHALNIDSDILVMNGNMLVLPNTIKNLSQMLNETEEIGAVGGMSNLFPGAQRYMDSDQYDKTVELCKMYQPQQARYVVALDTEAVMIKAETKRQLGDFDEDLNAMYSVMRDYFLRMIVNGWRLAVCSTAVFWGIGRQDTVMPANDYRRMEEKWEMHYFGNSFNASLVNIIKEEAESPFSVLEVGCDCAGTLVEIKHRFPRAEIYGTDISVGALRIASHFATVKLNNIEECNLDYPRGKFRYIIFSDVLEHLRDPLKVLRYCKTLLSEEGHILACIPNLMHISVIDELLKGNFTYMESGLLDKTHIHMFTYNEVQRLFAQAGFGKMSVKPKCRDLSVELEQALQRVRQVYPETPEFMFRTFQYIVDAV